MKYSVEIMITVPREQVTALFGNIDNVPKWQPELVSARQLEGEAGQEGSKRSLVYTMGKKEITMVETITKRNPPDEFVGTYEAKGVWNEVINRFYQEDEHTTKWVVDTEFRCTGMMKLMCWLMPKVFKKQTVYAMQQFKKFAESEA